MITPPNYIPVEEITAAPVKHHWDDDDPYALFPETDKNTLLLLSKMSDRAKIAFAIGCAEWVVYRFSRLSDDPSPLQFIEACWAVEMSDEFESPDESDDEDWEGPIRGPIDLSLMTILNTIYATEDGNAEEDAAFAAVIPLHVLPEPNAFVTWRDRVLPVLAAKYPYKKKNSLGEHVPREALDPSQSLDTAQSAKLIKAYLTALPKKGNSFLLPH